MKMEELNINDIILPPYVHIDEVIKDALNDIDAKTIKEKFGEVATDDWMKRPVNLSTLIQHIRTRDSDPFYTSKLSIYNDALSITLIPRTESVVRQLQTGKKSKLKLDDTTSKFKLLKTKDIEMTVDNSKALSFVIDYQDSYKVGSSINGMWLCGSFGVGKSYLMGALANELYQKGAEVYYIGTEHTISELKETMRYNTNNLPNKLWKLRKAEILILDDIGVESPTNWVIKEVLYDILNYRYTKNLATFFTSNYTQADYCERVGQSLGRIEGQRMLARLNSLSVEVQMGGKDRRKKAKYA